MAQPKRSELGFYLERIEPSHDPAWGMAGMLGQRAYWNEAARVGLRVKQSSIIRGIGRDGRDVADISPATRRNRRSAMTKSGKGSPSAKPLVPGYTLSRTYSYLRAIVEWNRVWFQWRHDPKTGMNWGQILAYQAKRGRDHFGFYLAEWNEIVDTMDRWWRANRVQLARRAQRALARRLGIPEPQVIPMRPGRFVVTPNPTHVEMAVPQPARRSPDAFVTGWRQFR